jgi:hypothetical protein
MSRTELQFLGHLARSLVTRRVLTELTLLTLNNSHVPSRVSIIRWSNKIRTLIVVLTSNNLNCHHDTPNSASKFARQAQAISSKAFVLSFHSLRTSQRIGNEPAGLHFDRSLYIISGLRDNEINLRHALLATLHTHRPWRPFAQNVIRYKWRFPNFFRSRRNCTSRCPLWNTPKICFLMSTIEPGTISAPRNTWDHGLHVSTTKSIQLLVLTRQPKGQ